MQSSVRVRFAPSPTGPLHIGGVRTALFNYLFAKKHGGQFILRIEDTDSARFVEGAEEYIIEAFKWCGIRFDEGVGVGGPHAPYRQSERKDIYWAYAEELITKGHAYYAFDTAEELNDLRKECETSGKTFIYNYALRPQMKTSLTLSPAEVEQLKAASNNWVVRFKIPENETVQVTDLIRGEVKFNTSTLDDKVLWKKVDELPTYHLANIVDDHLMEISHVIRGEEWLPSLPLHALLYRSFGWEKSQPQFAHLALLLKPDGKGKLSKRDGDKLGFPVFPLQWEKDGELTRGYREDGYFPDAFINMLALLGWNDDTDQEIYSMDQLIEAFDLNRVVKSGARFNPDKARWFNQQYLKNRSNKELADLYRVTLDTHGVTASDVYLETVCGMIKDRAVFISDFWALSSYFFSAPKVYDEKAFQKFVKPESGDIIRQLMALLEASADFNILETEAKVHQWIKDSALNMGQVMNTFRLAVVGASMGPSMFEIIHLIGKAETLSRLSVFIQMLDK